MELEKQCNGNEEKDTLFAAASDLCRIITERHAYLNKEIASISLDYPHFPTSRFINITKWSSCELFGKSDLTRITKDGRTVLSIAVAKAPATAYWRTWVLLDKGRYQFSGMIKSEEFGPDTKHGMSGGFIAVGEQQRGFNFHGTTDWKETKLEFTVPDGGCEMELKCYLSGNHGQAWFDLESSPRQRQKSKFLSIQYQWHQ